MKVNPNLSPDSSSPEQVEESIASLELASRKMVAEIDDPLMNNFRNLLKRYMEELSTDITEIAKGLKISRPLLTEFMSPKYKRNDLPLTPGKIYHLHATLIQTKKLSEKRRRASKSDKPIDEVRKTSQDARKKLGEDGADELLMAAGYLPKKLKMVPVHSQQHSQLSFISFLYQDRPFNPDLFSQIIQQEMDRREMEPHRNNSSKVNDKIVPIDKVLTNLLDKTFWLEEKVRESVQDKYERAIKTAEKDRNSTEKTALFKSVLHNQLNESEEISLKLRVIRIERIPLSMAWPTKGSKQFSKLQEKIEEIAIDSERILGRSEDGINEINSQDNSINLVENEDNKRKKKLMYPVTRTIVTCIYNEQEINLEYISRGTHVATAIYAIAINMGFHKYISTISVDVRWLGEDMKSLISAIVKIGNNRERLISGEWVSSDLLQTIVQAAMIAGRKWIYQDFGNELNVNNYEELVKKTAKIRIDFYENRLVFDRYDFENKKGSIDKFREINDLAKEWIEKLEQYPEKLRNNFQSSFDRIYILSKLHMLHHYSVQLDHGNCHRLIKEIDIEFYTHQSTYDGKILIAAKIGLAVEKIAYNISFGTPYCGEILLDNTIDTLLAEDLLNRKNILSDLEIIDSKIKSELRKHIGKTKHYNDPGYDIHYSLGAYYLTTSRLLFYIGKTKEEFESAFNKSLQAAYYFQRIGLSRKVQRSVILAGRVSLRIRAEESKRQAKQCEILSSILLKQSIVDIDLPSNDTIVDLSLQSRLNLLKGEYRKATTEENQEIFVYYLKSLKGSLWLGLNRHLADTLYIVSKHIEQLDMLGINNGIKKVFPEFFSKGIDKTENNESVDFTEEQIEEFVKDSTKNAGENKAAAKIVRQLFQMYGKEARQITNTKIAEELRKLSCEIWNNWHRSATGNNNSSHPFVKAIEKDTFLNKI
jgi:hypothetical protein